MFSWVLCNCSPYLFENLLFFGECCGSFPCGHVTHSCLRLSQVCWFSGLMFISNYILRAALAPLLPDCKAQGKGSASSFEGMDVPFGLYNSVLRRDGRYVQFSAKEIQVKPSSQTHLAATCEWLNSTLNSFLLTPAIFPLFLKSEFSEGFAGERDGGVPFRMSEEDFDLFEKFKLLWCVLAIGELGSNPNNLFDKLCDLGQVT